MSSIKKKKDMIIKIGYDTAFISGAVVILNFFLALYEYNTATLDDFNVSDPNFVMPVFVLMLSSAEIFYSYRRCYKQKEIFFAKLFSGFSFVLSIFLLAIPVLIFTKFCCVKDGYLMMVGNLADLVNLNSVPLITNKVFFGIYIISTIFQAIASFVKLKINKNISPRVTSETN